MYRHRSIFRHLVILLISVQLVFLTSCFGAGIGDWSYSDLPGDYEIWRINTKNIALVEKGSPCTADEVVPSYVFKVAWDEDFISAQQCSDPDDTDSPPSFYVVDVSSGDIYGPLTETEFDELAEQLEVPFDDSDWILTSDLAP